MKVVNLFGGPGIGKSTTAALLFGEMKQRGMKVELVTEFAKDLTYEGGHTLGDQLAILGEQHRRLSRLRGHVEWAVTDSPLLLGCAYALPDQEWLHRAIVGAFDTFDNVSFILPRVKPYQTYGRRQTEDEARALDRRIADIARTYAYAVPIPPGADPVQEIISYLPDHASGAGRA